MDINNLITMLQSQKFYDWYCGENPTLIVACKRHQTWIKK